MSTGHAITIDLPPELYAQVQEIAAQRGSSLQAAVVETLMLYLVNPSTDIEARIAVMDAFSDDQLWAVVKRTFPEAPRLQQLIVESEESPLSDENTAELRDLIDREDYHILLRSKALATLKERCHDVMAYLKSGGA